MSYTVLRGCWCDIIAVNVQTPTVSKIDDMKDSSYKELEKVFDKFPKYHMKILLEDLNADANAQHPDLTHPQSVFFP
jgi:hypothetical protein